MSAIEAEAFSGYAGLRQIELLKPQPARNRVLVASQRRRRPAEDPLDVLNHLPAAALDLLLDPATMMGPAAVEGYYDAFTAGDPSGKMTRLLHDGEVAPFGAAAQLGAGEPWFPVEPRARVRKRI